VNAETNVSKGYVYVLSNPSMPGIVKIGRSIHGGRSRARELNSTGVPTPFDLEFEMFVDDCESVEVACHEVLEKYRVNDGREFFKCTVHKAIWTVMNEYGGYRSLYVVDEDQFQAVIGAHYLSSLVEVDPNTMFNAVDCFTKEEVQAALKRHEAFVESVRKRLEARNASA
jgi:hypothetical protein